MSVKEWQASTGERCVSIGVGPVKVADYLERSQIVTRATPSEVKLADFDRWAEPLAQNIPRVLADNLSALLCTKMVLVFPWRGAIPIDYQIEVEILRLDGNLGGNVTLEAQWMAFGPKDLRKLVAIKRSTFREPLDGQDYQALVSAESRAIAKLSQEIARTLRDQMK